MQPAGLRLLTCFLACDLPAEALLMPPTLLLPLPLPGLFMLLHGLLSRVSFLAGLVADFGPSARKAYKVNGRRLLPSRRTTAKCMVRMLRWQLLPQHARQTARRACCCG